MMQGLGGHGQTLPFAPWECLENYELRKVLITMVVRRGWRGTKGEEVGRQRSSLRGSEGLGQSLMMGIDWKGKPLGYRVDGKKGLMSDSVGAEHVEGQVCHLLSWGKSWNSWRAD